MFPSMRVGSVGSYGVAIRGYKNPTAVKLLSFTRAHVLACSSLTPRGRDQSRHSCDQLTRSRSAHPRQNRVERPFSGSIDEQVKHDHNLRILRANLVQDGPHADFWRRRRQWQRRSPKVKRDFGRKHRHNHFDDEGNRDQSRQKSRHYQNSAHDLQPTDKIGGEDGKRHPEFGESSDSLIDVNELGGRTA
jgi:hypothetical protein